MPIAVNPSTGETVYLNAQGAWEKAQTAVNPQTKEMMAFDGQAWTPVPTQSKGILGYIDDAVRSVASGLTFGYADELAAKMDELTGRGGTYEQNVAKERARDAQIPAAIQIPGEIGGAVVSTIAAAPAAAAARAVPVVNALAQRLPAAAKFAGLGAAEGALAGSGNAVEGERLSGVGTGAAIGAAVGAVAPSVVRGVAGAVNAVRGAVSPQANVSADLARAITRDADDPASLLARTTDAQIERPGVATLADAGGENVRGLVERVAQTPGAGRTQVVPELTSRQQQQSSRIAFDLKELTGTSRTAKQAIDETIAARKTAAAPLYQKAIDDVDWANGGNLIDAKRNITEVVDAFNKQISTGHGKALYESKDFQRTLQTEYGINDASKAPLMVQIDAWKKTVDDQVSSAMREGKGNVARVLTTMRDDVVGVVDKHNPAYAEARSAWSGPSKYLESIESGRGILSTKESAEEFTARFKSLGQAEQEGERIGAVSAIIARMGGDSAKLGDMTKYLRSPEVRAKIAAIMPTPEAAEAWTRRLDFEVKASELTGRALGNSATARRLAERQDAEGIAGDLVMDVLTGAPQSLIKKILGAGPKWLKDTMRSRADAMLADVLTNPNSAADLPRILSRAIPNSRPNNLTNAGATVAGTELVNAP